MFRWNWGPFVHLQASNVINGARGNSVATTVIRKQRFLHLSRECEAKILELMMWRDFYFLNSQVRLKQSRRSSKADGVTKHSCSFLHQTLVFNVYLWVTERQGRTTGIHLFFHVLLTINCFIIPALCMWDLREVFPFSFYLFLHHTVRISLCIVLFSEKNMLSAHSVSKLYAEEDIWIVQFLFCGCCFHTLMKDSILIVWLTFEWQGVINCRNRNGTCG